MRDLNRGGMRDLIHEGGGMKDLIHIINSVQEVLDSCGVDLGLELPRSGWAQLSAA